MNGEDENTSGDFHGTHVVRTGISMFLPLRSMGPAKDPHGRDRDKPVLKV